MQEIGIRRDLGIEVRRQNTFRCRAKKRLNIRLPFRRKTAKGAYDAPLATADVE